MDKEFDITQGEENLKKINSVEVIRAVENFRVKKDPDSLSEMIECMVESKYLAPVSIDPKPDLEAMKQEGYQFPPETKIRFHMIENQAGKRYFLAFTSFEEVKKWREDPQIQLVVVTFDDIAAMVSEAESEEEAAGFVIDPYGVNQIFTREQTLEIKAQKDIIEKGSSES